MLIRYPVDLTGWDPRNLVSGERHPLLTTPGISSRIVVMEHGGFYTRGLKVYDNNLNLLEPNIDYVATYKYNDASDKTGLEVCGAILVTNEELTTSVYITAQMVGGSYAYSLTVREEIIQWFNDNPDTPVTWAGIVGTDSNWNPGELEENLRGHDTYQRFNNKLEDILRALQAGDQHYLEEMKSKGKELYDDFINGNGNELSNHLNDFDNPHEDNKNTIGLSNIHNWELATFGEMEIGDSNEKYVTIGKGTHALQHHADRLLEDHLDADNPHEDTPAKIGTFDTDQFQEELDKKYLVTDTVENTNNIDFSEEDFGLVFDTWPRFSRLGATFNNSVNVNELSTWQYLPADNAVRCMVNSGTFVGFVSPEAYDEYVLEVELSSTATDDDFIGVCIAVAVDEQGNTHTLDAGRCGNSSGGFITNGLSGLVGHPLTIVRNRCLTAAFGSRLVANIDAGLRWGNGTSGNLVANGAAGGWGRAGQEISPVLLKVTRSGDLITIETSQSKESNYHTPARTTINLNDHPDLAVFKGPQPFAYCCHSQQYSTWRVLQRPGWPKPFNIFRNEVRSNIPAENFTSGVFDRARLGLGNAVGDVTLTGNLNWTSIQSLFDLYAPWSTANVFFAGSFASSATAMAMIRSLYANINTYPVDTLVFYTYDTTISLGVGNGVGTYSYRKSAMAYRTLSGWSTT